MIINVRDDTAGISDELLSRIVESAQSFEHYIVDFIEEHQHHFIPWLNVRHLHMTVSDHKYGYIVRTQAFQLSETQLADLPLDKVALFEFNTLYYAGANVCTTEDSVGAIADRIGEALERCSDKYRLPNCADISSWSAQELEDFIWWMIKLGSASILEARALSRYISLVQPKNPEP